MPTAPITKGPARAGNAFGEHSRHSPIARPEASDWDFSDHGREQDREQNQVPFPGARLEAAAGAVDRRIRVQQQQR